jgi:hypothetical protein
LANSSRSPLPGTLLYSSTTASMSSTIRARSASVPGCTRCSIQSKTLSDSSLTFTGREVSQRCPGAQLSVL